MLGSIAGAAVGVAAGSLLYQGISGMMGHHNAGTKAGEQSAASPAPPAPEPANSLADADEAGGESEDATDYAALDGGDFDSGDAA